MALREKFLNVASERKCPARQTEEFLWISHHDTQLHRRELHRSKHAFVRFRHHRLRREKESAEHDLRFGNATTTNVSQNNDHRISPPRGYNDKNHEFERSVIGPSLQAGVLDGAPFLIGRTNQNPNIYFQHYRAYCARSCFPLCPSDVTLWFWKKVLDDPILMHIKLSISASHRTAALKAFGAPSIIVQQPAQDSIRFRLGTMKSLQKIFQNENNIYSESTVFLITHLIISEIFEANTEAVEMHMNGMTRIIAWLGGLDVFGFQTLAMIYSCTFLHGMVSKSPPIIPMCVKFEARVLQESAIIKASRRLARPSVLGTRFFNAPWSGEIQPLFKSIISCYQQLVLHYERGENPTVNPISVENDCLLYLSHRLLCLPYQCPLTEFEEIIRVSIFVYLSIRIWSIYGTPCLDSQVKSLRDLLRRNNFLLESTASDLLFWVLFIGSLASKGLESHSWFSARLVDIADQMHLQDWDTATAFLGEFLFICRPQDDPAVELWYSLFQRRSLATIEARPILQQQMVIR